MGNAEDADARDFTPIVNTCVRVNAPAIFAAIFETIATNQNDYFFCGHCQVSCVWVAVAYHLLHYYYTTLIRVSQQ